MGRRTELCKTVQVGKRPSKSKGTVAGTAGTLGWRVEVEEALLRKKLQKKDEKACGRGRKVHVLYFVGLGTDCVFEKYRRNGQRRCWLSL